MLSLAYIKQPINKELVSNISCNVLINRVFNFDVTVEHVSALQDFLTHFKFRKTQKVSDERSRRNKMEGMKFSR